MRSVIFLLLVVLAFGTVSVTAVRAQTPDIAISAIGKDLDGEESVGAVYIYDSEDYSLIRAITNPDEIIQGQFGQFVAYDENRLAVAAPWRYDENHDPIGGVYILDSITGSLLTIIENPNPYDNRVDEFGIVMSFVGNNQIAVSAPVQPTSGLQAAGTVYIFDENSGSLVRTIKDGTAKEIDLFGHSVVTVGDNIAVGIPGKDVNGAENAGAVMIYAGTHDSFVRAINNPEPEKAAEFGRSIAVSDDQKMLLVGAPYKTVGGDERAGAVYLFDAQTGSLVKSIPNPDLDEQANFGSAVVFAGDKFVVGAPGNGRYEQGSVHVFETNTGNLLKTIDNPQVVQPPESGYTNEFGLALAARDDILVVGDRGKLINGVVNVGGAYVYDLRSYQLIQEIDNPYPTRNDSFGSYVAFVGDMDPSQESIERMATNDTVTKPENKETSTEVWVEPQREAVGSFRGVLEYDKIPEDFVCDNTPRIDYKYVNKDQRPQYPEHDSLLIRIGGEDTMQDFQIMFSLWNEKDGVYAKDLSQHVVLKSDDGSVIGGATYSPDAYSVYSTLGVAVEANSYTNEDGILPADVRKKFTDLFGASYVATFGMPPNGNYKLEVRVFDTENDWLTEDTCGIQAFIPIVTNGEDDVSIGKIQFSNIKVSVIETNYENVKIADKIIQDAAEKKNNQTQSPNTNDTSEPNQDEQTDQDKPDESIPSPLDQQESGIPADEIQCIDGMVLETNPRTGDPMCLRPETAAKLKDRGWL